MFMGNMRGGAMGQSARPMMPQQQNNSMGPSGGMMGRMFPQMQQRGGWNAPPKFTPENRPPMMGQFPTNMQRPMYQPQAPPLQQQPGFQQMMQQLQQRMQNQNTGVFGPRPGGIGPTRTFDPDVLRNYNPNVMY